MTTADRTLPPPSAGPPAAGWLHRRHASVWLALLAAPVGWLVVVYLGSLAVLLVNAFWSRRPVHRRGRPRVHARQLRRAVRRPVYRDDHPAHRAHGGAGHRRPAPSSPSRSPSTWRRSRRRAAAGSSSSRCSCRSGRATSSRPTRGGPDPVRGRRPQLGARAARAERARATARSRSGSSSPTSGCRT